MSNALPLSQRVSGAMVWNTALFPVKFAVALGTGMILVRVLNKHDYAVYSLVLWVASLIGSIVDLGMERSVGRFAPEVEAHLGREGLKKFFGALFVIKLGVISPMLIAFWLAPDFFSHALALGEEGESLLAGIGALVVLGAVSDVFIQFLYTHFKQAATNLLDIVSTLLQPIFIIVLVLAGAGVGGILAAMIVSSVILDLLAGWRVRGLLDQIPAQEGERPPRLVQRFTRVAALNFLITATASLSEPGFAAVVLTGSRQLTAVAVLAIGYRFVNYFLRFLIAPLTGIQTPLFARLYHEKRIDAVREVYSTLTKFFIFTLVPSGLAMVLLAPRLIPFLFTTTYAESARIAALLVVLLFAETILGIPTSMLIVFESHRAVIVSRLLALLTIPLLIVLVPTSGALGAALAMGVPRVLSRLYSTLSTSRLVGIEFPFAFLFRVSAAASLAAVPLFITREWDWVWVLTGSVAFGSIFLLLFKQLGGFDPKEKERLRTLRLPFRDALLRWL